MKCINCKTEIAPSNLGYFDDGKMFCDKFCFIQWTDEQLPKNTEEDIEGSEE